MIPCNTIAFLLMIIATCFFIKVHQTDSNAIWTHNHLVRKQAGEMVECSFTN